MLVLVGVLTQAWEPVCYFGNPSIQHFNILVEQRFERTAAYYLCSFQFAMGRLHIDQWQIWLAAPQGCDVALIFWVNSAEN